MGKAGMCLGRQGEGLVGGLATVVCGVRTEGQRSGSQGGEWSGRRRDGICRVAGLRRML